MLVQWHSIQEFPAEPDPVAPALVNHGDDPVYDRASDELRGRLYEFVSYLREHNYRPSESLSEMKRRVRIPGVTSHIEYFVRLATYQDLLDAGWRRFEKDTKQSYDGGPDCQGRPYHIWKDPGGRFFERETNSWLEKDPTHNWGICKQVEFVGNTVQVVRETYACCGMPLSHPGCWRGRVKYERELYDAFPGFSDNLWSLLNDKYFGDLRDAWSRPPITGTSWLRHENYEKLDREIRALKTELENPAVIGFKRVYKKLNRFESIAISDFLGPSDLTKLEKILELESIYNQVHCGTAKRSPAELFAIDRAVVRPIPKWSTWDEFRKFADSFPSRLGKLYRSLGTRAQRISERAKEYMGLLRENAARVPRGSWNPFAEALERLEDEVLPEPEFFGLELVKLEPNEKALENDEETIMQFEDALDQFEDNHLIDPFMPPLEPLPVPTPQYRETVMDQAVKEHVGANHEKEDEKLDAEWKRYAQLVEKLGRFRLFSSVFPEDIPADLVDTAQAAIESGESNVFNELYEARERLLNRIAKDTDYDTKALLDADKQELLVLRDRLDELEREREESRVTQKRMDELYRARRLADAEFKLRTKSVHARKIYQNIVALLESAEIDREELSRNMYILRNTPSDKVIDDFILEIEPLAVFMDISSFRDEIIVAETIQRLDVVRRNLTGGLSIPDAIRRYETEAARKAGEEAARRLQEQEYDRVLAAEEAERLFQEREAARRKAEADELARIRRREAFLLKVQEAIAGHNANYARPEMAVEVELVRKVFTDRSENSDDLGGIPFDLSRTHANAFTDAELAETISRYNSVGLVYPDISGPDGRILAPENLYRKIVEMDSYRIGIQSQLRERSRDLLKRREREATREIETEIREIINFLDHRIYDRISTDAEIDQELQRVNNFNNNAQEILGRLEAFLTDEQILLAIREVSEEDLKDRANSIETQKDLDDLLEENRKRTTLPVMQDGELLEFYLARLPESVRLEFTEMASQLGLLTENPAKPSKCYEKFMDLLGRCQGKSLKFVRELLDAGKDESLVILRTECFERFPALTPIQKSAFNALIIRLGAKNQDDLLNPSAIREHLVQFIEHFHYNNPEIRTAFLEIAQFLQITQARGAFKDPQVAARYFACWLNFLSLYSEFFGLDTQTVLSYLKDKDVPVDQVTVTALRRSECLKDSDTYRLNFVKPEPFLPVKPEPSEPVKREPKFFDIQEDVYAYIISAAEQGDFVAARKLLIQLDDPKLRAGAEHLLNVFDDKGKEEA
jgi:hypothetical protein